MIATPNNSFCISFCHWYRAFPEQQQIYLFFGVVIISTILLFLISEVLVDLVEKISKMEKTDPQRWLYHLTVYSYLSIFLGPYIIGLSGLYLICPLGEMYPESFKFAAVLFILMAGGCVFRKWRKLFKAQQEIHGLFK